MEKKTRKDCQFLIDIKMLKLGIIKISARYVLVPTIPDESGVYKSTPVKSWNSLYTELEAMPSNAPAPDPEPKALNTGDPDEPIELAS